MLKAMWAPLVLIIAAAALGLTAWGTYPKAPTQQSIHSYASLYVTTSTPITTVKYEVVRVSSAVSLVGVEVDSDVTPKAGKRTIYVAIDLPPGIFFQHCPYPACHITRKGITYWTKSATLKYVRGVGWTTVAPFFVKAARFGVVFNRVSASASMPDVVYQGPGMPYILVRYVIPSAASYDWSPVPFEEGNSYAVWEEPLTRGETPAQTPAGVNHAAQTDDNTKTFIAGALVGLAGAALLAAAIEALHVRDWDALRALRQK